MLTLILTVTPDDGRNHYFMSSDSSDYKTKNFYSELIKEIEKEHKSTVRKRNAGTVTANRNRFNIQQGNNKI